MPAPNFWENYQYNVSDFGFRPDPNAATQQRSQLQQLSDAKQLSDPTNGRWNDRTQTGFDDEADNRYDDYKIRQEKNKNMGYNNQEGGKQPFVNYSSRPSDYKSTYSPSSISEKLFSDFQKYNQEAQVNLYKANTQNQTQQQKNAAEAQVNFYKANVQNQTQQQKNAAEAQFNLYKANIQNQTQQQKNAADDSTARQNNQLQSQVKRELGIDSNTKTLEGTKYGVNVKATTERFQWTTPNPTSIAEAQIKAGTYGVDPSELNKRAADKANLDRWTSENQERRTQADHQNALAKYNREVGNAERSYSDNRIDRINDQAQAMSRYNQDQAFKLRQYNDQQRQAGMDRNQQMQERSNATNRANAEYSNRQQQYAQEYALKQQQFNQDYALRKQAVDNQTAQINSNIGLDNSKYTATRADLAYNRNAQARSFAF